MNDFKNGEIPLSLINKISLIVFLFRLCCAAPLHAQNTNNTGRYANGEFFDVDNIVVKDSVIYGWAKNQQGQMDTLDMKIYYPDPCADSLEKRPLVVLIHGGSYFKGDKTSVYNPAFFLAKRGFVTAAINYRLGWNYRGFKNNGWDSSFYRAIYKSVQDSKAAIRFLINKATSYGIDTSKVFIGGISAGAVTALCIAFYSQHTWDMQYPWLKKELRGTDNSTNTLTDKFTLKGVFDICGGIGDTAYISGMNAKQIALIIFHGTADSVVSYTRPKNFKNSRMTPLYGGYLIAQRYKHLNACYQLFTNLGGGHGEGFKSWFIAEKIGTFCKSLFEGTCESKEITIKE